MSADFGDYRDWLRRDCLESLVFGGKFSRLKACTRPAALTIINPRAHRSKDLVWPGDSEQVLDRASKRANSVRIK